MSKKKKAPEPKICSHDELKAKGFMVDTTCYPNVAYKGLRFNPTEWHVVFTELEWKLYEALIASQDHHDYCGWGDSWERECATQKGGVKEVVEKAIADAEAHNKLKV